MDCARVAQMHRSKRVKRIVGDVKERSTNAAPDICGPWTLA